MQAIKTVLLIGNQGPTNVADSFWKACARLAVHGQLKDVRSAYGGSRVLRRAAWHLLNKRPPHWFWFQKEILRTAQLVKPELILTTGFTPLSQTTLRLLRSRNKYLVHYSTDDPWNLGQKARWFLDGLKEYHVIYSTRKSNLTDFKRIGCQNVSYLPFGYDDTLYSIWKRPAKEQPEIFFAGGCDLDRIPIFHELAKNKISLCLYGDYWNRDATLNKYHSGRASSEKIREKAAESMVSLLLVRRANRDGSAMRSFEIPACGACCVAEDTEEHREMFGPDGEAVLYFRTPEELVRRVKEAFVNPELRKRLRKNAYQAITGRPNTYVDRLKTMLEKVEEQKSIADKG